MPNPNPQPSSSLGDLYHQRPTIPATMVGQPHEAPGSAPRSRRRPTSPSSSRLPQSARRLRIVVVLTIGLFAAAGWSIVSLLRAGNRPPPPAPAAPAPTREPEAELMPGPADPVGVLIATAQRTRDLMRAVRLQVSRGMVTESIAQLEAQREHDPNNVELQQMLAEIFAQAGRFVDAEKMLMQVLSARPDQVESRLLLARIVFNRGEFEAAAELARWILETEDQHQAARLLLAESDLRLGWNEAAVRELQTLYERHGDDLEVRNLLALGYLRLGQYGKAIFHLSELIRQDQPEPTSFYNLAVCYAQQNLALEAVEVLNQSAARLGPSQVAEWLDSDDFSPVSKQPVYLNLRRQMMFALASQAVKPTVGARHQLKLDRGVGLLPEIKSDIIRPR